LSELSKSVAWDIFEGGGELIFPSCQEPGKELQRGSPYTVSNKVLAIVDAEGEDGLRRYVKGLKETALARLLHLRDQALGVARGLAARRDGIDEERMDAQLRELIEFYAGWAPYREDDYQACRREAEDWTVARKTLRDFEPHRSGAKLPKSSLDGIRETVIRKDGLRKEQFFVKPNEQLDGIGLVKRFVGKKPGFDSTIDVAAAPYLARLAKVKPRELKEYEDYLKDNEKNVPFSYGYLYRHESRSPMELGEPYAKELDDRLKKWRFPEPKPPYYAFLLGDGDSMGEAISGIRVHADHQEFSARLSRFATDVHKKAEEHTGWNVVFAGGDDVMALLPLHEALDAAVQFRRCFLDAMRGLDKVPTFTIGMVIAHALEPLSEVRRMAKQAERKAKQMPGKDAMAIIAAARSGAPVEVCDHWGRIEDELKRTVELYRDQAISPSFAYALRDLLDSTARRDLTHLDEVLYPLARALAAKKEAPEEFTKWLQQAEERAGAKPRQELQRLCGLLMVARPIARALREATV
jgi:CRISPR-associated protein Cmr2